MIPTEIVSYIIIYFTFTIYNKFLSLQLCTEIHNLECTGFIYKRVADDHYNRTCIITSALPDPDQQAVGAAALQQEGADQQDPCGAAGLGTWEYNRRNRCKGIRLGNVL